MIRRLLSTARYLAAFAVIELLTRRDEVARLQLRVAALKRRVAERDAGTDLDGEPLTESERAALRRLIRDIERERPAVINRDLLTAAHKALGEPWAS